jgi:AcrR family transcriptional regulator
MGRKPRFTQDSFTKAALEIVSREGPAGLTMAAVAKRVKAPVGSVYHRFPSRDILIAELWLQTVESFQEGFLELLEQQNGLDATLYTSRWVREHMNEARLLLLHRREELMSEEWPAGLADRARRMARRLDRGIEHFTKTQLGEITDDNLRRTLFAVIDVPFAAVRGHLQAGEVPPPIVDHLVAEAYSAVMGEKK